MSKPMSTKSKIQLWICKQQKDYFSHCEYDDTYVWVGYDVMDKFIKFIGNSYSGDFLNISCSMQENCLCFTWEDLLDEVYV